MALMYDSVNPFNIPTTAEIVAGYINGKYAWSKSGWDRFPNSDKVTIQIYIPGHEPTNDGLVLDIEGPDAPKSRGLASRWVQSRRDSGIIPCIYTSKSSMLYLGGLPCDYWLADWTDINHIVPGTVATQWASFNSYDISTTVDYWPRKAGSEPTVPNGKMVSDGGFQVTKSGKGYWLFGDDGGVFAYGDAGFFGSIPGLGIKPNSPVTKVVVTPTEQGYWMVSEGDWGVFGFGDAEYLGHPS